MGRGGGAGVVAESLAPDAALDGLQLSAQRCKVLSQLAFVCSLNIGALNLNARCVAANCD